MGRWCRGIAIKVFIIAAVGCDRIKAICNESKVKWHPGVGGHAYSKHDQNTIWSSAEAPEARSSGNIERMGGLLINSVRVFLKQAPLDMLESGQDHETQQTPALC